MVFDDSMIFQKLMLLVGLKRCIHTISKQKTGDT